VPVVQLDRMLVS